MSGGRLRAALCCYVGLGVVGYFVLADERMRTVLGVVLAGLAVKSWVAWKQSRLDN